MCYLHEVVELYALTQIGTAHRGAVYACVGSDFHIVFDGDDAYLRYFVVSVSIRGESEAVGAYYGACMYGHVVSDLASVVYCHVGVEEAVVAYLCPVADSHVWVELAVVAHHGVFADACEWCYVAVVAHLCGGCDGCERTYSCLFRLHRLIELQQLCHGFVCVFHSDECCLYGVFQFYVFIDKHDTRLRVV